MKQCSLHDFMKELEPWLDTDHIRGAEWSGGNRLIIHFLDGMKNEMDVRGKRVLDREIVESFINNKNKNEEINY